MFELPPVRTKQKIPCPVCKVTNCYKHCNHCGKSIQFKKDYSGKSICYEEGSDIVHRCMGGGTKDGQYYNVKQEKKYYTLKSDIGTHNEGRQYWFYPAEPINIREYDYTHYNYMCMQCAREYNQLVYPKCPSCWKMECRKCFNKQSWRIGLELNKCNNCGHNKLDPTNVWRSFQRLYGEEKK